MSFSQSLALLSLAALSVSGACAGSKPSAVLTAGHAASAEAGSGTALPQVGGSAGVAAVGGAAGQTAVAPSDGGVAPDAGNVTQADDDAGTTVAKPDASTTTDSGTGDTTIAPRGTGPGDWVAGDYPPDITMQTYLEIKDLPGQAGNTRQYKVHVPPSYVADKPMPVVFCIHGLGQNAVMFCNDGAGMPAKSDAAGFILVMPNGYQNSWNAGTCCGGAVNDKLDDVGLMRAIFKEVSSHLNIDLARVYATGLSNGGYLSYRLACQAADLFTAVAPGSGAIGMDDIGGGTSTTGDFSECKPTAKVSVLDFHGDADPLIPYKLQKPSLERIAAANGCALTTHPATQPMSGGDTTCVTYDGCPKGIDVSGCSVKGGGHVWFGNDGCGTGAGALGCAIVGANSNTLVNTDAAWEFFRTHAR